MGRGLPVLLVEVSIVKIYQYTPRSSRPPGFEGLPYGLRVRVIGRPDQSGRVRVKDLQGRILGLVPLADLGAL